MGLPATICKTPDPQQTSRRSSQCSPQSLVQILRQLALLNPLTADNSFSKRAQFLSPSGTDTTCSSHCIKSAFPPQSEHPSGYASAKSDMHGFGEKIDAVVDGVSSSTFVFFVKNVWSFALDSSRSCCTVLRARFFGIPSELTGATSKHKRSKNKVAPKTCLEPLQCVRMGPPWVTRDPMSGLMLYEKLTTTSSETMSKEWTVGLAPGTK